MMMKCMHWTIILAIAFMLCAYSYEDDFEREIEALLDDMAYEDGYFEDGNSADLILKRLDSLAAVDEFISVRCVIYIFYLCVFQVAMFLKTAFLHCLQANDDSPVIIGFFDLATNKKDFDTFEQVSNFAGIPLLFLLFGLLSYLTYCSLRAMTMNTTVSDTSPARRCWKRSATVDAPCSRFPW